MIQIMTLFKLHMTILQKLQVFVRCYSVFEGVRAYYTFMPYPDPDCQF